MTTAIVHLAGEYADLVQRCDRCGVVLADHRNTMYRIADGPPRAWEQGAEIASLGNAKWVVGIEVRSVGEQAVLSRQRCGAQA